MNDIKNNTFTIITSTIVISIIITPISTIILVLPNIVILVIALSLISHYNAFIAATSLFLLLSSSLLLLSTLFVFDIIVYYHSYHSYIILKFNFSLKEKKKNIFTAEMLDRCTNLRKAFNKLKDCLYHLL